MKIFPAIDLIGGKAVRLFKGDYDKVTIYNDNPLEVALDFQKKGANQIHLVDLEGAKDGSLHNFETIINIKKKTGLFAEVGGGIRDMDRVSLYLDNGIDRVILGTAAVKNPEFLNEAVAKYGDKIAVGADFKDGFVAIHGWTEKTDHKALDFCKKMENIGVKTLICTDISKDGVNKGTNIELYKELSSAVNIDIIASGGVSSIENVKTLREMNLYGAIIGRAYYDGLIDLREAVNISL